MEIEQNLLQSSFTTYRSVFQSFRAAEFSPSKFMKIEQNLLLSSTSDVRVSVLNVSI